MRRFLLSVLLVLFVLLVGVVAFRAGVSHAVRVACPAVAADGSVLIDFDGVMHAYD